MVSPNFFQTVKDTKWTFIPSWDQLYGEKKKKKPRMNKICTWCRDVHDVEMDGIDGSIVMHFTIVIVIAIFVQTS